MDTVHFHVQSSSSASVPSSDKRTLAQSLHIVTHTMASRMHESELAHPETDSQRDEQVMRLKSLTLTGELGIFLLSSLLLVGAPYDGGRA